MHIAYIVFSLLLSSAHATSDWMRSAENLMTKGKVEEMARKELLGMEKLDQNLKEALDQGGRSEQLALSVIRVLARTSMVEDLLQRLDKKDMQIPDGENYAVTLLSMVATEKGNQILDRLYKKIDITSARISSSLRINLLSSMNLKDRIPPVHILLDLLADPSFEMRLKVMDVAAPRIIKGPYDYETFLKKSFTVSPYPVRLKALEIVELLSPKMKILFKKEIETCAKSDQSQIVQEACKNFQFKN